MNYIFAKNMGHISSVAYIYMCNCDNVLQIPMSGKGWLLRLLVMLSASKYQENILSQKKGRYRAHFLQLVKHSFKFDEC